MLILLILILLPLSIQAATWQSTAASDYNVGTGFDFNWSKVTQDANVMPVGDDRIHNDQNQAFYDGNLVVYWKFNDSNATHIFDDTNNNRDANFNNGADINAWGLWDTNAGYFDGTNDFKDKY